MLRDFHVFISGTGSGIGQALALELLQHGAHVEGISRKNAIRHPKFRFHALDLTNEKAYQQFKFPDSIAQTLVLVNNAGLIAPIAGVEELNAEKTASLLRVNTFAPMWLTQLFLDRYLKEDKNILVLNISSGAAHNPISGWSAYCSSKAALDMYTNCLANEFQEKDYKARAFAISPGVVDTAMQEHIRFSDSLSFTRKDYFTELKSSNALANTQVIAKKISHIIQNSDQFQDFRISLRDLNM